MPRISSSVLALRRSLACVLLFASTLLSAASMGSFTGEVVRDVSVENGKKWIFLKSGKRAIRRVDISDASVSYSPDIPKPNRAANPAADLHEGTKLTVTASQDENGEWKATKVEIVSLTK